MSKFISFVSTFIVLICAQVCFGQIVAEGYGVIQGVVTDTLIPPNTIEDAEVSAFDSNQVVLDQDNTDSLGRYTLLIPLNGQDSGTVNLSVMKSGYLTIDTTDVTVVFGTITIVDFQMRVAAGPIEGIVRDSTWGLRLPDVHVYVISDPDIWDSTNVTGQYYLEVRDPGTYDICFECKDFKTDIIENIFVDYGDTANRDNRLDRVNWHVDDRGIDIMGAGYENFPLRTIQYAIGRTNTGDTVLVDVGTYVGINNRDISFNINPGIRDWIVVKSKFGSDSTIIDCQSNHLDDHQGFILEGHMDSNSMLSGFTITNARHVDGAGILIREKSSPVIEYCKIVNDTSEQSGGGIAIEDTSKPLIRFCEIRDNYAENDGGGISILRSWPTIENCTIVDNCASWGGGVQALASENDTIFIRNSIIRDNIDNTPQGQIQVEYSDLSVSHSDIEGGWPGTGNFDCYPWFCHKDSFDFHLSANSNCLYASQDSTFVGVYGEGCDSAGIVHGQITKCASDSILAGVSVTITTYGGMLRSSISDSNGHYRITVPGTPDSADILFSHPEPTMVTLEIMGYFVLPGDSAAPLDVCLEQTGCEYVVGDINGSGEYNGLDVTFGVEFFKGNNTPPYTCECPPGDSAWYVAGDVNASCTYNGLDVTYGVEYFKENYTEVNSCPACPGTPLPARAILNGTVMKSKD